MCAVSNMAVFCSSLISCLPVVLITFFLNHFEVVSVVLLLLSWHLFLDSTLAVFLLQGLYILASTTTTIITGSVCDLLLLTSRRTVRKHSVNLHIFFSPVDDVCNGRRSVRAANCCNSIETAMKIRNSSNVILFSLFLFPREKFDSRE